MKPKSQPTKCWMTKMKIKYSILKERQKKNATWVNLSKPVKSTTWFMRTRLHHGK